MTARGGRFMVLAWLLFTLAIPVAHADPSTAAPRLGTQEVGLIVGPILPWRVKPTQSTKLFGVGAIPSWSIALTDPIGTGWYQGQLRLGVEFAVLQTHRPVTTWSVGVTPKLAYTFTAAGRWRPFVEGGGGPIWTELGGQVPEQPGWFNFLVMGGGGLSYVVSPQLMVTVGGRFAHISNGGLRPTNRGLNFGFPYVGFSWQLF